jgi:hypothetical protein
LNVFLHDGDAFSVQRAKVCIFKKMDKESFGGLLERLDRL